MQACYVLGPELINLYLYCVREIHECFILYKLLNGDLLHPDYELTWLHFLEFVDNFGSDFLILSIGENSFSG